MRRWASRGSARLAEHGKHLLTAAHHLPTYAERVAAQGDEDFADGLAELAESLATLSAAATDPTQPIPAADITRMRFIAARLRVILHEITAPHLAPLRAELAPVLAELTVLTTQHTTVTAYT
ncbi:hypothetical protein [Streptosporangium vulgare]|uniref:Uncharacterized protein n=1 Tax=Streptosporangium vulgare TaxID=46190 RepID=A0ABV5TRP2_9ACTN